MNTTTAYTPLESLLLFQSLAASGTDPDVFIRTSNLLKTNALIRASESYDPGRLSPDALRELYLQLLREELRLEASQGEGRGDVSPSRKRKIQSPQLPNIKDANEYSEKLPVVVNRLYGLYRDYMIRSIREDERKYEVLQREIEEIERGEWDERILRDDRSKSNRAPSIAAEDPKAADASATPSLSATTELEDNEHTQAGSSLPKQIEISQQAAQPSLSSAPAAPASPRLEQKPEGLAISDVLNTQEKPVLPPSAAEFKDPTAQLRNGLQSSPSQSHQRINSNEKLRGPSPLQPLQQRPPENWKWEQYHGGQAAPQPPQFPPNNYPHYSNPPYPPYPPVPHRGSFNIPPGHNLPLPQGHVPSSPINNMHPHPIVLPPLSRPPASPATRHLEQLADVAEQQYRAPSGSPLMQQGNASGSPFMPPYPPYPPPYRPNDGRSPSNNGPTPQWNQHYAPQYPPPPPNYAYPPQPLPNQRPFPARPDMVQPEQRQYNSPYIPNQGPRPSVASASSTPRMRPARDISKLPHTPGLVNRPRHSTGKATQWTPTPTASTPKAPRSPVQPAIEPLSPVSVSKVIAVPTVVEVTPKPRGRPRKDAAAAESQARGKGQRGAQRTRIGSPASSVIAESFRSQSVTSHADELSLVHDGNGLRGVKQESATPRAVDDIVITPTGEDSSRRRVNIVKDLASPRIDLKRKRHESPARVASGPPAHVLWTRNFPRITASALERIGAHRSASTFAQPIKERDAPGYKDLILRPQDLKSIRMSINTGYKAGLAVVSAIGDSGQPGIMLPISNELIPPRGIINNAQLEKELMRMFANAIMFNHDPDRSLGKAFEAMPSVEEETGPDNYELDENGVVKETRAMFVDVKKIVGEMRSAEWRIEEEASGSTQEEEVEPEESGGGSVAKRRRRA